MAPLRTRSARFLLALNVPQNRPVQLTVTPARGLVFREKRSRSVVELSFEDAYAAGTKMEKSGQLVASPAVERKKV